MSVRGAQSGPCRRSTSRLAINFGVSIYLARYYIGPDELGLFSIAFAATTLIAVFQDFGLTRYVAGEADLDDAKIRAACSLSLVIAGAIAVVSMALAWPMAALYDMPQLAPLMLVIGASYLLLPFTVVPRALIQRKLDFKSNTIMDIGAASANAVVSIHLARHGAGAMALAWGTLAQFAARALIAQWRNGLLLPWPLSFDGARPILKFGGGSSLLVLSGTLSAKLPDLVIGRLINQAAVGLFGRANGLSGQLRTLVSGAVTGVFYPAFARVRDRGEPLGPHYERVVSCYCGVTWPTMAGLAILAEPLIRLLYGERWLGAAPLLQWIAISEICFVALPLHVELPILLGRMKALIHRNLLDTLASVLLLAVGAYFSLEAAAASRFAYSIVWIFIYIGFLHTLVGFRWGGLLANYAKSGLATIAAIAPTVAIYAFWQGPSELGFAEMLAGTLAGIFAWLVTLWLTDHPLFREFTGLIGDMLGKLRRPAPETMA
ncbi:MAG: lipopolysaccharide biosynthesis protein [Novosphingobium sp.]|nr:lipopolysaccharide biosynthesis protein [Novosphingobium sp.]